MCVCVCVCVCVNVETYVLARAHFHTTDQQNWQSQSNTQFSYYKIPQLIRIISTKGRRGKRRGEGITQCLVITKQNIDSEPPRTIQYNYNYQFLDRLQVQPGFRGHHAAHAPRHHRPRMKQCSTLALAGLGPNPTTETISK